MKAAPVLPSSFRDPSGFLFCSNQGLLRQINTRYAPHYDHLMKSGLYHALVDAKLLIPHDEAALSDAITEHAYKVIKPEFVKFISYPYEWCFSQLKDAALTTLTVQKKALEYGMSLKDATGYNIQFHQGLPLLIDTLSFEKYREGEPWVAYRQFCQHFLAPLALMTYTDMRLSQLLRVYLDGLPLDMTSSLLPLKTWGSVSVLTHLHIHARSQAYFGTKRVQKAQYKMSRHALCAVIESLESAIRKLRRRSCITEWSEYYTETNYSLAAAEHKRRLVGEFIDRLKPSSVWDFGANVGAFSRISADKDIPTVSFDNDHESVERNYTDCVRRRERNMLPLVLDLSNPSPNIGWEHRERLSILERGPAHTALALALIHHLCISNNVPLGKLAEFFTKACHALIIEFVPKADSQVQRLLASREDIFPDYTQPMFEMEFGRLFDIESSTKLDGSDRTLPASRSAWAETLTIQASEDSLTMSTGGRFLRSELRGHAPVHNAVDRGGKLDAQRAGHAGRVLNWPGSINQRFDPLGPC